MGKSEIRATAAEAWIKRTVMIAVFGFLLVVCFLVHVFLRERRLTLQRSLSLPAALAIERAIHNFEIEYNRLPEIEAHLTTDTPGGIKLLTILLGMEDPSGKMQNSRSIKFLNVREAKNKRNGLIYSNNGRSIEGIYDAWGNPFVIEMAAKDQDGVRFKIHSKDIFLPGRIVAVHSAGLDKQLGTSDDVRTW